MDLLDKFLVFLRIRGPAPLNPPFLLCSSLRCQSAEEKRKKKEKAEKSADGANSGGAFSIPSASVFKPAAALFVFFAASAGAGIVTPRLFAFADRRVTLRRSSLAAARAGRFCDLLALRRLLGAA